MTAATIGLRRLVVALVLAAAAWFALGVLAAPAQAAPSSVSATSVVGADPSGTALDQGTDQTQSHGPSGPSGPSGPKQEAGGGSVTVNLGDLGKKPSSSVTLIVAMTLLSLLPAIFLTCTCFTKILVVLGLTRNALGLQQTPPNQVLAGLALFLSLFIMAPVISAIYHDGVKPYMDGDATSAQAWDDGIKPLKTFMLKNADDDEIALLSQVADRSVPDTKAETPMTTVVPAFILSELKDAFIIGFIIFIPFLVIDIVVSGALMALGMMMMPPVMVSLPFKLLLFVLVNGWGLVITGLVGSYG